MNVYAHRKNAFDDRAEYIGQLFAVPAAMAVQNAQVLAQTQRLAAKLQTELNNGAVIDQAVGIIISRTGVTAEEAVNRIRGHSQRRSKMTVVATRIVDEAVRRARARITAGPRPAQEDAKPAAHHDIP